MKRKFDALDYVVFVLILFISIFIGLYFGLNLNEKLSKLVSSIFRTKKTNQVEPGDENEVKEDIEIVEMESDMAESKQDGQKTAEKSQTMNYFTANSSMGQ